MSGEDLTLKNVYKELLEKYFRKRINEMVLDMMHKIENDISDNKESSKELVQIRPDEIPIEVINEAKRLKKELGELPIVDPVIDIQINIKD